MKIQWRNLLKHPTSSTPCALLVQLVERRSPKPDVGGSSPPGRVTMLTGIRRRQRSALSRCFSCHYGWARVGLLATRNTLDLGYREEKGHLTLEVR